MCQVGSKFYRPQHSYGKVIFSSVCHSVHGGGGQTPSPGQTPLLRRQTPPMADRHPPPADGYCSGRYASYWNAFLYIFLRLTSRRFRTGPGVVPAKVPQDVENLVIVLNGREDSKVEFSTVWLNYLTSSLPRLVNLAVVMLGNEMCINRYVYRSHN